MAEKEVDRKRFSLNDLQKMCMGVIAVAGLWYNQIRESDHIRADFREFVAVQAGVDKIQDYKIEENENGLTILINRFDFHINSVGIKSDEPHIESE